MLTPRTIPGQCSRHGHERMSAGGKLQHAMCLRNLGSDVRKLKRDDITWARANYMYATIHGSCACATSHPTKSLWTFLFSAWPRLLPEAGWRSVAIPRSLQPPLQPWIHRSRFYVSAETANTQSTLRQPFDASIGHSYESVTVLKWDASCLLASPEIA